jgi:hypothetical protein
MSKFSTPGSVRSIYRNSFTDNLQNSSSQSSVSSLDNQQLVVFDSFDSISSFGSLDGESTMGRSKVNYDILRKRFIITRVNNNQHFGCRECSESTLQSLKAESKFFKWQKALDHAAKVHCNSSSWAEDLSVIEALRYSKQQFIA